MAAPSSRHIEPLIAGESVNVSVSCVSAQGFGTIPFPTVSASGAVTVTAVPAQGFGSFPGATVTVTGSVIVTPSPQPSQVAAGGRVYRGPLKERTKPARVLPWPGTPVMPMPLSFEAVIAAATGFGRCGPSIVLTEDRVEWDDEEVLALL